MPNYANLCKNMYLTGTILLTKKNIILPTELHTIKTQVCVKFQLDPSFENGKTVKKTEKGINYA